jgi:hypothetical protein
MASMNKPASNDSDWYQDLTDNWTSIENNLIDKSILTSKGDLIAATGSSVPANFGVGNQGEVLTADSTQTAGLKWSNVGYTDVSYVEQLQFNTRFFSAAGLLPGTKYYQTPVDTAPTTDWDNTGVASTTFGTYRRWEGVSGTQLLGWDLGGAKQRILMIVSGFQNCNVERYLFMLTSKPNSGAPTGNGYLGGNCWLSAGGVIYKMTNGGFTNLSATNYVEYVNHPSDVAMLFDNGNVRYFFRYGNFEWMEGVFKNDGTYTTLQYCGIYLYAGQSQYIGPVSIYYDT